MLGPPGDDEFYVVGGEFDTSGRVAAPGVIRIEQRKTTLFRRREDPPPVSKILLSLEYDQGPTVPSGGGIEPGEGDPLIGAGGGSPPIFLGGIDTSSWGQNTTEYCNVLQDLMAAVGIKQTLL